MCSNWIIPFLVGMFVGQEFEDAPRVRPYIESGIRKVIQISKDVITNTNEDRNAEQAVTRKRWKWNLD
jgi:hypothetical protein